MQYSVVLQGDRLCKLCDAGDKQKPNEDDMWCNTSLLCGNGMLCALYLQEALNAEKARLQAAPDEEERHAGLSQQSTMMTSYAM